MEIVKFEIKLNQIWNSRHVKSCEKSTIL